MNILVALNDYYTPDQKLTKVEFDITKLQGLNDTISDLDLTEEINLVNSIINFKNEQINNLSKGFIEFINLLTNINSIENKQTIYEVLKSYIKIESDVDSVYNFYIKVYDTCKEIKELNNSEFKLDTEKEQIIDNSGDDSKFEQLIKDVDNQIKQIKDQREMLYAKCRQYFHDNIKQDNVKEEQVNSIIVIIQSHKIEYLVFKAINADIINDIKQNPNKYYNYMIMIDYWNDDYMLYMLRVIISSIIYDDRIELWNLQKEYNSSKNNSIMKTNTTVGDLERRLMQKEYNSFKNNELCKKYNSIMNTNITVGDLERRLKYNTLYLRLKYSRELIAHFA